jgi:cytochrome c biogenesis protein CcmG/thiol:disulfide interchange protein DsbE
VRIFGERLPSADRPRGARRAAAGRIRLIAALLGALLALAPPAGADGRGGAQTPGATGLAPIDYGKPAPDFTYDAGAGPKKLSDSLGSPVLVHFWDSWCVPCTGELPLLVRARQEDPGLTIITLSDEEPGIARAYLKKAGLDLPVAEDTGHKVFRLYGVHAIPVSVFLRPDGTVEHVSVGAMAWPEIAEALARMARP